MKRKKGFTLIEILIAVTIIGVLSTITVFSYKNYVDVTNESSTRQELVQLAQIFEIGVIEGFFEHSQESIDYSSLNESYKGIVESELPFTEEELFYNNRMLTLFRRGVSLRYNFETRSVENIT